MAEGTARSSQSAAVSGVRGTVTFDLKSWKGLTEILKVARDAGMPADQYAEFRDLVLQYAQSGGEKSIRTRIEEMLATLPEEAVAAGATSATPAKARAQNAAAQDLDTEHDQESDEEMAEEGAEDSDTHTRAHPDNAQTSAQDAGKNDADTAPQSRPFGMTRATPQFSASAPPPKKEVRSRGAAPVQSEPAEGRPSGAPKKQQSSGAAEVSDQKSEAQTDDGRTPPEPSMFTPDVEAAKAAHADEETPATSHTASTPEPQKPHESSEGTSRHSEETEHAPPASAQKTPAQSPAPAPQSSGAAQQKAAQPDQQQESVIPPPGPAMQLSDYKFRIQELKQLVNEHVGNPVALMDPENTAGRAYMDALLAAMKAVGGGAAGSVRKAMADLESAAKQVLESEPPAQKQRAPADSEAASRTREPEKKPSDVPETEPQPTPQGRSDVMEAAQVPQQNDAQHGEGREEAPDPKTQTRAQSPGPQPTPPQTAARAGAQNDPQPAAPPAPTAADVPVKETADHKSQAQQDTTAPAHQPPQRTGGLPSLADMKKGAAPLSTPARTAGAAPSKAPAQSLSASGAQEAKSEAPARSSTDAPSQAPESAPQPQRSQQQAHPASPSRPSLREQVASAPAANVNGAQRPPAQPAAPPAASSADTSGTPAATPQAAQSYAPSEVQQSPTGSASSNADAPAHSESRMEQDPYDLQGPLVTEGLYQLLSEWKIFNSSGFFGTGPSGVEHPLYKRLAPLAMGVVTSGRFDGATKEVTNSINDYVNAWRHEQGITYTSIETFDHYLRRVVQRILKRKNGAQ